jgi:cyclic dehypoxanthinyl futalosine synthase
MGKSSKILVHTNDVIKLAAEGRFLSAAEGLRLWKEASLGMLMASADTLRHSKHPDNCVGWIIDRNVNITNICMSMCTFCNFCRPRNHPDAFITTMEQYRGKIDEMVRMGGDQLLLQGGMHPGLGLDFYIKLFRELKSYYPSLKLHALGPPEIVHLAQLEGITFEKVLQELTGAGLDSLPGAGAEILSDRVRNKLSPKKATVDEWLEVMLAAHRLGMVTSATMMFGHIETVEERIEHMMHIRGVQLQKPEGTPGFVSFIPWPFQDENTVLRNKFGVRNSVAPFEYVRTIALARLMIPNVPNIQASWLTVGKGTAQLCLHAGANDFGSIMIEENVVSQAGAKNRFDSEGIQKAIREAGFIPRQRNQRFEYI